jgi:hypothetical protein
VITIDKGKVVVMSKIVMSKVVEIRQDAEDTDTDKDKDTKHKYRQGSSIAKQPQNNHRTKDKTKSGIKAHRFSIQLRQQHRSICLGEKRQRNSNTAKNRS